MLKAIFEKRSVYASLPTGYGKSMIFYALSRRLSWPMQYFPKIVDHKSYGDLK